MTAYPLTESQLGMFVAWNQDRGFNVDLVSRDDFAAMVESLKNDPTRAGDLQGILHYTGLVFAGSQQKMPTLLTSSLCSTVLPFSTDLLCLWVLRFVIAVCLLFWYNAHINNITKLL